MKEIKSRKEKEKKVSIPIARPKLSIEEEAAAIEVIKSGWIMQGKKVEEFEKIFAEYVGAKEAIAVSSGTTAIHLALLTANCGISDTVICPSYSFIATANAIKHCGAEPIFVDIDKNNYNMDPIEIESKIRPDTKAILVVHQVGFPAKLERILKIAEERNLMIIEDAACAIGTEYKGERIGKPHGLAACFSFHPRKIITTGDGGMITTNSKSFAARAKRLRQHGMGPGEKDYIEIGYNFRLTDIQAAIGIEQIKRIPELLKKRREQAAIYIKALKKNKWLLPQEEEKDTKSNYQAFQVRLMEGAPILRDELIKKMIEVGITVQPGIKPIHLESIYKNSCTERLLETEKAAKEVIMLPLYDSLTLKDQQYIIDTLIGFLK